MNGMGSSGGGSDPGRDAERDPGEDSQLIAARLKERDPAALRQLYQQEERRAFALALRVSGGDAASAEDAVQEAFTQLWARAGQLSVEGGRIESLLMTIVRRRAVDLARRQGRTDQLPDPDVLQQIDERASALLERVEENLTTEGLRTELKAALQSLPVEQRHVVNSAYFGGLTLPQIAERESLPLGTVKSRLRLAMTKLTETMRKQRHP
jgi:RNA polymerase sigma factor (sigma-70 family)